MDDISPQNKIVAELKGSRFANFESYQTDQNSGTDIKGSGFLKTGRLARLQKFYIVVTHGQQRFVTQVAKGITPAWNETWYFNLDKPAQFLFHVFIKSQFTSDVLYGECQQSSSLLESGHAAMSIELPLSSHQNQKRNSIGNLCFNLAIKDSRNPELLQLQAITTQAKVDINRVAASPLQEVQPIVRGLEVVKEDLWRVLFTRLKKFTVGVDKIAEVHPYARMAWSILKLAYDVIENQNNRDDNMTRLADVISDTLELVLSSEILHKSNNQKEILARIAQQITECAYFIREYALDPKFASRAVSNFFSDMDSRIRLYEDAFRDLRAAFEQHTTVQTGITVFCILGNIQELASDIDLNDMPYAAGAGINPEKSCLLGTRETILEEISDWVNDSSKKTNIFFLSGVAGSGKSSIAHTVAQHFQALGRLGSFFCFDRSHEAERRHELCFSTIARDLADAYPQQKRALQKVIKDNRSLRTTRVPLMQFDRFLLEPSSQTTILGPLVIVIDALDESGDPALRKGFLTVVSKRLSELPGNYCILITSRPELDIVKALRLNSRVYWKDMQTIAQDSTLEDIAVFFQSQIPEEISMEFEPNWCSQLVGRSEGLFQWASTACLFLAGGKGGSDPVKRFHTLLSSVASHAQEKNLDTLYYGILEEAFEKDDLESMSRFKSVVGQILAAKQPLSADVIQNLQPPDAPNNLVISVVKSLGSLFSGTMDSNAIYPLHTSCREFLVNKQRSKEFYVNLDDQNEVLGLGTFRVMKTGLYFNICNLETSCVLNKDVKDLDRTVQSNISPTLVYSCLSWADHLVKMKVSPESLDRVSEFLFQKFLYWVEVLSLLKRVNIANLAFKSIEDWIEHCGLDVKHHLQSFIEDARKFIAVFGGIISHSVPHIYLSALPFSPHNSKISRLYLPRFPNTLELSSGKPQEWPALAHEVSLEGHTDSVNAVAISPLGKIIASGASDKTIRIWDTETGVTIVGPLVGHTGPIRAIMFSPDGRNVVSSGDDKTICIWDVRNGRRRLGPLIGHDKAVWSVVYSADGRRLASGSADKTIQVWDADTGVKLLKPIIGHQKEVLSVAYSPDGNRIASSSMDKTIFIWDALTGMVIAGPIIGHTDSVWSVAFSPDGSLIASGSTDSHVRLWDGFHGNSVAGPFEGHTDGIGAVAFSPDGTRIVSASSDNTLRVWDVNAGNVVAGPFIGHEDEIESAVFSGDGSKLISGSCDGTVRIWNAKAQIDGKPFVGHQDFVQSVAVSPDGRCIASGSADRTILLWDADIGNVLCEPLVGHEDGVWSVKFSPDGKFLASGSADKTLRVWDLERRVTAVGPLVGHKRDVLSVAYTSDGSHIASGSKDETVIVWNVATGEAISGPLVLKGSFSGQGFVWTVAFSPDGKKVMGGCMDTTIHIWDIETGNTIYGPFKGRGMGVGFSGFSPDGKHAASGFSDGTIWILDLTDGKTVMGPIHGHEADVLSLAYSRDGRYLVTGSVDKSIRVWNAETGSAVTTLLRGHLEMVTSVTFFPDGNRIVSSSDDKTIRTWGVENDTPASVPLELRNDSKWKDGWILGPEDELLFWVPSWNRLGLRRPCNKVVLAPQETKLNFARFKYGTEWSQCLDEGI